MKALRTTVCAYAVVLLAGLSLAMTTPLKADSSDFAGIYGAIHVSVNGASIDGSHVGGNALANGITDERTTGKVGGFIPIAGYELGFNLPLGDLFFLGVGTTVVDGSAELTESDTTDHNADADITLEISDARTYFIQPSMSLYGNSAIYVKLGRTIADLTAIGDVTGTPGNLTGDTYALGTTTIANNGLFIKTEAGVTSFETVQATGVGGTNTAYVEGDPIVAYGSLTLGFKF